VRQRSKKLQGAHKRSGQPQQSHKPVQALFPSIAKAVPQAREVLEDGLAQTGPHKKRVRQLWEIVKSLLADMELLAKGEISQEEDERRLSETVKTLKIPRPPNWLPPELALAITSQVREAERTKPGALGEFKRWIDEEFALPRGRPTDPNLSSLYRAAAELHAQGMSWMQIARKLCPRRGEGHRCNKHCADRFRNGALQYL
jgi:hypothetical protein